MNTQQHSHESLGSISILCPMSCLLQALHSSASSLVSQNLSADVSSSHFCNFKNTDGSNPHKPTRRLVCCDVSIVGVRIKKCSHSSAVLFWKYIHSFVTPVFSIYCKSLKSASLFSKHIRQTWSAADDANFPTRLYSLIKISRRRAKHFCINRRHLICPNKHASNRSFIMWTLPMHLI